MHVGVLTSLSVHGLTAAESPTADHEPTAVTLTTAKVAKA